MKYREGVQRPASAKVIDGFLNLGTKLSEDYIDGDKCFLQTEGEISRPSTEAEIRLIIKIFFVCWSSNIKKFYPTESCRTITSKKFVSVYQR